MTSDQPTWERRVVPVGDTVITFFEVIPQDPRGLVLFCHGWGQAPLGYRDLLTELARDGWRVVAPAFPGYAGSAPVRWRSSSPLVEGATRVADALGGWEWETPTFVLAHSMGATPAAMICELYAEKISGLMLVCPVGEPATSARDWGRALRSIPKDAVRATSGQLRSLLSPVREAPLLLAATGLRAKRFDSRTRYADLAARGLPLSLIKVDGDLVVHTDEIACIPGITCFHEHGTHGFPLNQPGRCAELFGSWAHTVLTLSEDGQGR